MENTRPLIGISGSRDNENARQFIKANYMEAVMQAGGLPVLLPQTEDVGMIEEMVSHLDGILLAGGCDVLPARFGEETLPECGEIDLLRDAFELSLTDIALRRDLPILGICRGIQVLAVALGGTLIQDIESQRGIERPRHYQEPPYNVPVHAVRFEKGSFFGEITGTDVLMTNSMHHQSIKDPGPKLTVDGMSEDGIIEAAHMTGSRKVFATQFHPEYLQAENPHARRIFTYFVDCCRK